MRIKRIRNAITWMMIATVLAACGRGEPSGPPPPPADESPGQTGFPPPSPETEPSQRPEVKLPANLPPIQAFRGFAGASGSFVTDVDFGETDFPVLHITAEHHRIYRPAGEWVAAAFTLENTEEVRFEGVTGRIRGRGNSSWGLDKKPFRIRFDQARELLDAGHAARDWTFIANHSDKALMRNYSAYYLAGLLDGMSYAPYARFVDVYFNGEYQGVYQLCIQVSEVREGRVDLTYDEDPYTCEYLLELNRRIHHNDVDPGSEGVEGVDYVTVDGRHYEIRFPDPGGERLTPAHVAYIRRYIAAADRLIQARDPEVFDLIDKASFIDYYLVQELYKTYDISSLSVFMQIRGQGEERRLEKGPVWDLDIAAGNCYYQDRDGRHGGYGPTGLWAGTANSWFRRLLDMPEYFDAVSARWADIRDREIKQTIEHIETMAERHRLSFERNFIRWPVMGEYIWPNPQEVVAIDSFEGQVGYLTDFLRKRAAWMDGFFQ
jgi:hypothetical protein